MLVRMSVSIRSACLATTAAQVAASAANTTTAGRFTGSIARLPAPWSPERNPAKPTGHDRLP
jgi:hypothetical protein